MNEGDKAPQFALLDQDGETVKLSDHARETVVLYFYPRADGISPDEPAALRKFADKHDLDFTLVGDPDHSVAEAYGTWVEKSMYGEKYMGVQRATFIIDGSGKIAKVFPKVSPKTHDDVVLKALADLKPAS